MEFNPNPYPYYTYPYYHYPAPTYTVTYDASSEILAELRAIRKLLEEMKHPLFVVQNSGMEHAP